MEQDVHITFGIILAVLGSCIGLIAWFIKSKIAGYDVKHDKHFASFAELGASIHAMETKAAGDAQQMIAHIKSDEDHFVRVEGLCADIRTDLKEQDRRRHEDRTEILNAIAAQSRQWVEFYRDKDK